MFVHADLLHLLANSLGLWMLGSAVEQRLGGEKFLLYYLYCGVGAAIFALVLSRVAVVAPFVGRVGCRAGSRGGAGRALARRGDDHHPDSRSR